ncbi:hypothetical protein [Frankia sp. AgKG'84/4]|uniref:hypothetical protein n=1 Tax=Frankia sp. AgKG'84/4 TaxID=573490 RepID=UPI002029FEBF|nr:hypothetical protein [Frankia sp. AgKG'84/4]MCL9794035.1 hypothetical protein [Frankia sp. AgKG'84/4]
MPPYFGVGLGLGLLDVVPVSSAPESMVGRALFYFEELDLGLEEFRALLALQKDYYRVQREGRLQFAIEGHLARPTAQPALGSEELGEHLEIRAQLFADEEARVPAFTQRVRKLLGVDRWNLLVSLYMEETRRDLLRLGPAIATAVASAFTLHDAVNSQQVDARAQFPASPGVEREAPVGSGDGVDREGYGPWGETDSHAGSAEPAEPALFPVPGRMPF